MSNELIEVPQYTEKSIIILDSVIILTPDNRKENYFREEKRHKVKEWFEHDYKKLEVTKVVTSNYIRTFFTKFNRLVFSPCRRTIVNMASVFGNVKVDKKTKMFYEKYYQLLPFLFRFNDKQRFMQIGNELRYTKSPLMFRRFFKQEGQRFVLPYIYPTFKIKKEIIKKEFGKDVSYSLVRTNKEKNCTFILNYYVVNEAFISYIEQSDFIKDLEQRKQTIEFVKELFNSIETQSNTTTLDEYCEKKAKLLSETIDESYLEDLQRRCEEQRQKRLEKYFPR